jgi:small subunit ribosomal protein S21
MELFCCENKYESPYQCRWVLADQVWRRTALRVTAVNAALRVLKRKLQREGTFREMKRRRAYEKPSERRAREQAEAVRRYRKAMRKRLEREGY